MEAEFLLSMSMLAGGIGAILQALNECWGLLSGEGMSESRVRLDLSFEEFSLDMTLSYKGTPIRFPEKPPDEVALLYEEGGQAALGGFLVWKYTDKIDQFRRGDYEYIRLHLDH